MILLDSGRPDEAAFDALLALAAQLRARAHRVWIDERALPENLDRRQKYEAVTHAAERADISPDLRLVIGAEDLQDAALERMRSDPDLRTVALGRFDGPQGEISARSKIAYATGRDPEIVDLNRLLGPPLFAGAVGPLAAPPAPAAPQPGGRRRLMLLMPAALLHEPSCPALLSALGSDPRFGLCLVLIGAAPEGAIDRLRHAHMVLSHTDLTPTALAKLADAVALFGAEVADERVAAILTEMFGALKPVLDCTAAGVLMAAGAPAVQGPDQLAALGSYFRQTVLPNLAEIGRFMEKSAWLERRAFTRLETALGLAAPGPAAHPQPRTVFLPTNGVGLGHAQRSVLIAAAMEASEDRAFLAFPSCVPMIRDAGFACLPLIQKSTDHADEFANDLLNYRRLDRHLRPGDRLVFDGGYVFESIRRAIVEKDLTAVWVRRGLWQAGQAAFRTLAREQVFARIVVPDEAFEELNDPPRWGGRVDHVGPVVRLAGPARTGMRRDLMKRLKSSADRIIVTMLGGGAAADRSAQLQTLCNIFERRDSCLQLIVVWPGSVVPPGLLGWKSTRVVHTRRALDLCRVADLVISAAGYNSFHEMLYHAIPAIFMPQMAPFMDDQDRRARAASDRGLAATVDPDELHLLEREIAAFLEGGRAAEIRGRLAALTLPEPGTAAAAALISQTVHQ
jgi:hypothetical protein